MERWSNRVAFVTGANGGIGAAIVECLVKAGLQVVGFDKKNDVMKGLVIKLKNEKGKLYPLTGDLTKAEDVTSAFKWVGENLRELSILVNNAGVGVQTNISDFELEKWHETFNVNLFGMGLCSREAIKLIRKFDLKDGHIININSVLGHLYLPFPKIHLYSMSKHSVTDFTKLLRSEMYEAKVNIKITSVSPGLVTTNLGKDLFGADLKYEKMNPFDISNAILYILSVPEHLQITELTIAPCGAMC